MSRGVVALLAAIALIRPAQAGHGEASGELPKRPEPVLELGNDFLGQGAVTGGIMLPTGAVWQPTLLVFGTLRTALQTYDVATGRPSGAVRTEAEWANRLDLFVNLSLTGTERILLGFRPLDDAGGFSGYDFGAPGDDAWRGHGSARIETLFFEGDFGELFPRLDGGDRRPLDLGLAIGRQPLFFQEGLLLADSVDAFGVTRNTLRPADTSNVRVTGIVGWGDVDRDGGDDDRVRLAGLFTELDDERSTYDVDLVLVHSPRGGTSVHAGVSAVQRWGTVNTAVRWLSSAPFDDDGGAGRGSLLFGELSWTPRGGHDLAYVNGFVAFDQFTPAARDRALGGPLARTGILFEGAGLGRAATALDASAHDAVGLAVGYQKLIDDGRSQLVAELGLRHDTGGHDTAAAAGVRFQRAIGRRTLVRADGFESWAEASRARYGGRLELLIKF